MAGIHLPRNPYYSKRKPPLLHRPPQARTCVRSLAFFLTLCSSSQVNEFSILKQAPLSENTLLHAMDSIAGDFETQDIAIEGNGTWQTWVRSDPQRLQELLASAKVKLHARWPDDPVDPTGSDDGSATCFLRREAHTRKVFAGMRNYIGYDSFIEDFAEAITSLDAHYYAKMNATFLDCGPVFIAEKSGLLSRTDTLHLLHTAPTIYALLIGRAPSILQ